MPNILEVVRELKFLQARQNGGNASPAELARIQELEAFMKGSAKPAPPVPPARPAIPPDPKPDEGAFALSMGDDLMSAFGETEDEDDSLEGSPAAATTHVAEDADGGNPFAIKFDDPDLVEEADDSHASKTTFEIEEEAGSAAGDESNPFALGVPDELAGLDLQEDDEGGVTHELEESELSGTSKDADPYRIELEDEFASALEKADGTAGPAPDKGPKGTPIVPDEHYAAVQANDASVVVHLRDRRVAKGVAVGFGPAAASFQLNQLVPGKAPVTVKLDECATVRFVRSYNGPLGAAAPFPATSATAPGERVSVKLLDGESLVGTAQPHREGESFILVPAASAGNVRRVWIAAKAIRSYTKI